MDRPISYTGAVPLLNDFLRTNRYAMVALGSLAEAVLGTSTLFDGLACTPTSPASLQVLIAPGSVYAFGNVDGTAYGNLGSDTTHQTVKQGIVLDVTTLNCPAPATTGYSINYLIQAEFQDQDTDSVVLPYFNSASPPNAFNGPAGVAISQNTTRKGACVLSVKAGTAATSGTQATPTPDAGFTALWVVTVANGSTAITSGNIALAANAPFISEKLGDKISLATGDARYLRSTSGFGLPSRTALFTSSGTWTAPSGVTQIIVSAVAGGAGGGGCNSSSNGGEGGGGGAAVIGDVLTVVPGTTYTITIGAGGAYGGVSANGSPGGTTSIGALLTLTGGSGGNYSGVSGGGAGGSGGGFGSDANLLSGGMGGGSLFGIGGATRSGAGLAGNGYGAGGAGGSVTSGSGTVGGAGSPGFVLIQW